MSKYTTEVRYICESKAGLSSSVGANIVDTIIENSRTKIFNFNYPIFDETYRPILEKKILKHYYTREIGLETVGLWQLKLNTVMNEIMPYYNKLYKSELIEFNPLYDTDLKTVRTVEENTTKDSTKDSTNVTDNNNSVTINNDNTKHGESESTINQKNLYSDTPQNGITDVESGNYLTNATIDNTSTNGTQNGTSHSESVSENEGKTNIVDHGTVKDVALNMEDYVENITGKSGGDSFSKRLIQFRETFLNIDLMVVEDKKICDLFMMLW